MLFVSPDPVGEQMAGLGIRYYELGRVLSEDADVTVATGAPDGRPLPGVQTVGYSPHAPTALRPLIAGADVIVGPPQWPMVSAWMRRSGARIIHDLYVPEQLETIELFAHRRPAVRRLMVDATLDRLHDALRTAHHLACASEKQRDLWLGALLAQRRLDLRRYDDDPSYRAVVDTVPFGVPTEAPVHRGGGPRRHIPGISENAEIVLWNGGIWRWLDAPTAIRAIARLHRRRPSVRLVFMGTSSHPVALSATQDARRVAAEEGVLDRAVFFHEQWVPYAERSDWLLDAACSLSTAADHLETRFAFRTRLLDCLWSGLPIVCTSGDDLANRVANENLGAVVPPGDVAGLADAVERVLSRGRETYADGLARAAADYAWPKVAHNLWRWIHAPAPLPRRLDPPGAVGRTPAHRARAAVYRLVRPAVRPLGVRAPAA